MSLKEIKGFLLTISRNEITEKISDIAGVATSAQGDSKSIKKAIDNLKKDLKKINNDMKKMLET